MITYDLYYLYRISLMLLVNNNLMLTVEDLKMKEKERKNSWINNQHQLSQPSNGNLIVLNYS